MRNRKHFSHVLLIGFFLVSGNSTSHAGLFVGKGGTGAPFLKIPISARAAALSESFSAIAGDITSLDYNPAGVSNLIRTDILASYIDYIEDTSLQSISFGIPIGVKTNQLPSEAPSNYFMRYLNLGVQYRLFRTDDIERNVNGVKGNSFDIRDQLLSVGFGYPFSDRLSMGISGKLINQTIQSKSASHFAVDFGSQYKWTENMSLGAAIQNVGSSNAFIDEADPLPTIVRTGLAWHGKKIAVMTDISQGRDSLFRASSGVEWVFNPHIQFRGGVSNETSLEFNGGIGVKFMGPQKAPVASAPRKPLDTGQERKNLEDLETTPLASSTEKSSGFTNIDIGLDYGLSTHKELDITHTVSIRILY